MTGVNAYDGKTGWKIEPWQGKKDAEPLGEEEMKGIVEDADFDGPLVNYQQKGNKVEYVGTEPVEGTDAYKLKVTLENGDVRYYFMDTDYYVPIKVEMQADGARRRARVRDLARRLQRGRRLVPAAFDRVGRKGSPNKSQITFETIEANVAIDDSRFDNQPARPSRPDRKEVRANDHATKSKDEHDALAMGGDTRLDAVRQRAGADGRGQADVKVDSETISGLGRAQHRLGGDERPHRRARRRAGGAAADDLRRRGQRRRLEVGQRRHDVQAGLRQAPVQSIGAVTIDPKNPKDVWVGTGESWTRNSVSVGDGVYKSTDGGENWTNVGLKESERIAKILVDPTRPNTVYVCAPGKLWSDSDERGVYKTTDGGKTWTKVLKGANASTGCSMISMDSAEPEDALRRHVGFRRKGWTFRSGGEGAERAERQRPVQEHRRRRDLDRARRE